MEPRTRFIHDLIREYRKVKSDGYHVDVYRLSNSDKLISLSHIVDVDEYEEALKSQSYLESLFNEHSSYIQQLVDEEINEVYSEDMHENGYVSMNYEDNGEEYWVKRNRSHGGD